MVISSCCFDENGREMYRNARARAARLFFLFWPIILLIVGVVIAGDVVVPKLPKGRPLATKITILPKTMNSLRKWSNSLLSHPVLLPDTMVFFLICLLFSSDGCSWNRESRCHGNNYNSRYMEPRGNKRNCRFPRFQNQIHECRVGRGLSERWLC